LGTGTLPSAIPEDFRQVEIPQEMLLQIDPELRTNHNIRLDPPLEKLSMVSKIFTDLDVMLANEQYVDLSKRAILCPKVNTTSQFNDIIIERMLPGPTTSYFARDDMTSQNTEIFTLDQLHMQQPSGFPPFELKLKVGTVVLLLRNLNPEKGLGNGTRLIVVQLLPNVIVAKIISESHRGDIVFLVPQDLETELKNLPVTLRRQQFPIIPAFAMTINKSQGQTLENVGIFLTDAPFSHGQLYVAFSRCRSRENIVVHVAEARPRQGRLDPKFPLKVSTTNVVFREVFVNGEIEQEVQVDTVQTVVRARGFCDDIEDVVNDEGLIDAVRQFIEEDREIEIEQSAARLLDWIEDSERARREFEDEELIFSDLQPHIEPQDEDFSRFEGVVVNPEEEEEEFYQESEGEPELMSGHEFCSLIATEENVHLESPVGGQETSHDISSDEELAKLLEELWTMN
jgi:hypothetical protein